jgi:hypothetical protein
MIHYRRFAVAVACFLVLIAPIQNVISVETQQQCVDAAVSRHDARVAGYNATYNAAMVPITWKYDQLCLSALHRFENELAALSFTLALSIAGCNLDPEPITKAKCIDLAVGTHAVLVLAAYAEYENNMHDAWVDYYAAMWPLYNTLTQDTNASWATLQQDYYACINNNNNG